MSAYSVQRSILSLGNKQLKEKICSQNLYILLRENTKQIWQEVLSAKKVGKHSKRRETDHKKTRFWIMYLNKPPLISWSLRRDLKWCFFSLGFPSRYLYHHMPPHPTAGSPWSWKTVCPVAMTPKIQSIKEAFSDCVFRTVSVQRFK